MTGGGTQEIKREYVGGNVRFDFPRRPLGRARLLGVILVGREEAELRWMAVQLRRALERPARTA